MQSSSIITWIYGKWFVCNVYRKASHHIKFLAPFPIIFICYIYFRYQFVPQLIFLNSLFGYLSLLIIVKWCTGSQADLYHVMIYMFLSPTDDLGENQLFPGQKFLQVDFCYLYHIYSECLLFIIVFPVLPVSNTCSLYQIVLLLLAFVAVPWMLVPKPFLLKKQHQEVCLVTFPYHKTAYFVSCFSFPLLFCSQLVSKNFECPFFLSFCFL